ncbi:Hypothetical_protein [Hexamita inflata]|uniref:Hypothetical_protein n=1 Tax=Hexamita inflata TaxID=28002 RepID=A0AA86UQH1_9EUKA|nr:Hypothetical protein HINF_LOCUS3689 [Hexamita inflata]CAI9964014.1 Hypothetical protein HINF_LOCUS51659 [Hexamita inflata]
MQIYQQYSQKTQRKVLTTEQHAKLNQFMLNHLIAKYNLTGRLNTIQEFAQYYKQLERKQQMSGRDWSQLDNRIVTEFPNLSITIFKGKSYSEKQYFDVFAANELPLYPQETQKLMKDYIKTYMSQTQNVKRNNSFIKKLLKNVKDQFNMSRTDEYSFKKQQYQNKIFIKTLIEQEKMSNLIVYQREEFQRDQ